MKKDKLSRIILKYSLDNGYLIFFAFSIVCYVTFLIGIFESLNFLIPIGIIFLLNIFVIIKILITRKRIITNDLVRVKIEGFNAFIKETKETNRHGAVLIKLYVIDKNKKKYNYYYLTGSEVKFKEYKSIINKGNNVELLLFKKTKIISDIIVDGEKLEDLYREIKYSKKLNRPITYNHYKTKRTKRCIYKYEEYDLSDVQIVFENATIYEELYIINNNNKYAKISFNQETHDEFLIDNNKFKTFEDLTKELEINGFIIDDKLRVIYTLENAEPSSFITLINEVK